MVSRSSTSSKAGKLRSWEIRLIQPLPQTAGKAAQSSRLQARIEIRLIMGPEFISGPEYRSRSALYKQASAGSGVHPAQIGARRSGSDLKCADFVDTLKRPGS